MVDSGHHLRAAGILEPIVASQPENARGVATLAIAGGDCRSVTRPQTRRCALASDTSGAALAHMQLGFALAKQGAYPEALAELKTAAEQDSSLDAAKAEIKRVNALRR
ncbi:MAG TPA: hypothetical protein VKB79_31165 [Bryobacteraceae bacterium]|nr:hypothetical protein [Bryobacteraceae bacterium]